ncbi:class I SAM-dependent methyltransferase [Helicobacter sp. faydin-H20]|uniref:class I SAM-dependent methyltransferase n=1 Tax=Helicobacter anatolicus TaxID=2905874 RepID=UPI001E48AA7E|nr:class I SAM-dependent methyltransferase [Helicobacter anatolicus]MCE3036861.1 class I SAM-dependent methyltransferase [Helicobacter anatolicus]
MDYFDARGISRLTYENYKLPSYMANIIHKNLNARILDFGCGFGQNLLAISQILKTARGGGQVKGIDINLQAIESCKNQGLDAEVVEDIFTYQPIEKFDIIFITHVLEHFPKDQIIPLLKYLKSHLLKDKGILLIAVPNAQSHTGAYWAYEDFTHNVLFTSGSLIYVLKMAGFENLEFLDKDCLDDLKGIKKLMRQFFLKLYKINNKFWNKITCSAFHAASPEIFSYELKIKAS